MTALSQTGYRVRQRAALVTVAAILLSFCTFTTQNQKEAVYGQASAAALEQALIADAHCTSGQKSACAAVALHMEAALDARYRAAGHARAATISAVAAVLVSAVAWLAYFLTPRRTIE